MNLTEIWKNEIESIEVNGWTRRVLSISDEKIHYDKTYLISFELDYLNKDGIEIDDFSNKFYSKWSFKLMNSFIDKLKFDCDDYTPSSNWTEITFKNDFADYIEYNTYYFKVSLFEPITILREENLRLLGF
jgi:hypothetical protein